VRVWCSKYAYAGHFTQLKGWYRLALCIGLIIGGNALGQKPKTIAVGHHHALAFKAGYVWSWGANTHGQLGSDPNSVSYDLIPQALETLPEDIVALAAGGGHSLALDGSGIVWAWGRNQEGQLGDGTVTNQFEPVKVNPFLPADANVAMTAISAGEYYSLALDQHGDIWVWGDNSNNQLGFESDTGIVTTPVRMTESIDPNILAITAGWEHSLAIVGTDLYGWGRGTEGQLNASHPENQVLPLLIPEPNRVQVVAAGGFHSLALDANGIVWAWGENTAGQLGDGSFESPNSPVMSVFDPDTEITEVLAGARHSLAVDVNQRIWAWGDNQKGQLGNGAVDDVNTIPMQVALDDVSEVVAGHTSNLALDTIGIAWDWGQLPLDINDIADVNHASPTMIPGFPCILEIEALMGGRVSEPSEQDLIYGLGETIPITAEPNEQYQFAFWSGSAVDRGLVTDHNQAATTLMIEGDHTLQANFALITYALTIESTDGGSVIIPGEGDVNGVTHAVPVTIVAERASDEYSFDTWRLISGEGVFADATAMETTFTLASDCTIRAEFEATQLVQFVDSHLKDAVIKTLEEVYGIPVQETPNNKDMEKLDVLDASQSDIKNLTGLEAATNLRSLNLNDNMVSGVNPLIFLTFLQFLYLERNNAPDLNTISQEMTQLVELHISGNSIADYQVLNHLKNLEVLMLNRSNQSIEDIPVEWLTSFTRLKVLGLKGNQGLSKWDTNVSRMHFEVCIPNGGRVLADN